MGGCGAFAFEYTPINFATTCNRAFHGRKIYSEDTERGKGIGGFGLQIRLVSCLALVKERARGFALRKRHANA